MKNTLYIGLSLFILMGTAACTPKQSIPQENVNFVPVIREVTPSVSATKQKTTVVPSSGKPITLKPSDTKKIATGDDAVKQANAASIQKPVSGDYVNAIMYFGYQPGLLYQIYCAPLHITDIEFQAGEEIVSASGGDTSRWSISETTSGDGAQKQAHLLVKPRASNINNVVVVTTNKRSYHLLLKSSDTTYMPIVAWHYPDDGLIINHPLSSNTLNQGKNDLSQLNKLDFNYIANVSSGRTPDWMPTMIFNDGQKTYIRFASTFANAPTLFISSGESERVVNYRVAGDYYIVDTVIQQGELRMGKTVVTINYGKG
jgi:type IV secretion system protein VirB9